MSMEQRSSSRSSASRSLSRRIRKLACACALGQSWASCPDFESVPYCSGHGDCNIYSRCDCWPKWQGGDCSERICPSAAAWADLATDTDVAHAEAECSNRGLCDRLTGRCECDVGFEGAACERLKCPGGSVENGETCTGHGSCSSMHELSSLEFTDESTQYTYTDVWDANKVQGCRCETGYSGVACAEAECPLGDDPLTSGQFNEVQLLSCAGFGYFTLKWRGIESGPIYSTFVDVGLQKSIEAITGESVSVRFSHPTSSLCYAAGVEDSEHNVAVIEFTTKFGSVSPLVIGDEFYFSGSINVKSRGVDGDLGLIRDHNGDYELAVATTKEAAECAGRGICSTDSGLCECFTTNFELYGSSDLYGGPGLRGDCGFPLTDITTCPGETECSDNGLCRGSNTVIEDDDATPFPTMSAPQADWHADGLYKCACIDTFRDGDCSQRTCARGPSWFGYPSADEVAHDGFLECSGAGVCDRLNGVCICPWPFEGAACDRMACPVDSGGNACGRRGRCASMREMAWAADSAYGDVPTNGETWDADRIFGCICDDGWTGYNCARRTCTLGDDPHTRDQSNELQYLMCDAEGGSLTLSFRSKTTAAIPYDATAGQLKAALEGLSTIGTAAVSFVEGLTGMCNETNNVIAVQFQTEHSNLPALTFDDAALTGIAFSSIAATDGDTLTDGNGVVYTSVAGTTESEECSSRGLCDRNTGLCGCFRGYGMSDGMGGPGVVDDCGFHLAIS